MYNSSSKKYAASVEISDDEGDVAGVFHILFMLEQSKSTDILSG